ncbi:MAG: hypothetical protein FWE71_02240 [Nocardioidaceae bacterium]|nr:hypothetical protein [Nocardioidaceae bacterium]MCL2611605.1 hypothetical protein [Nocardioidaceae bacterium]
MPRESVLHDIKNDLDGMPSEIMADIKQLIDDAGPALGSAVGDARSRSAAVGATLVGHLPDQVVERVPDAISDRLPGASSGGSKLKKVLIFGGVAAIAAAGLAAWKSRSAAPAPAFSSNGPSANGHRANGPTTMGDETSLN